MLGAQSELSAGHLCSSPPELLQVTRASCLVTGSKSKCPEKELGKSCLTFYSLALEITSHHFHHTLITEAVAKAHPGSRKGEIVSRGGSSKFWKSLRDGNYCWSYFLENMIYHSPPSGSVIHIPPTHKIHSSLKPPRSYPMMVLGSGSHHLKQIQ